MRSELTERDFDVTRLRERIDAQDEAISALANRIESHYKRLSNRIEHATDVAAGRDAR